MNVKPGSLTLNLVFKHHSWLDLVFTNSKWHFFHPKCIEKLYICSQYRFWISWTSFMSWDTFIQYASVIHLPHTYKPWLIGVILKNFFKRASHLGIPQLIAVRMIIFCNDEFTSKKYAFIWLNSYFDYKKNIFLLFVIRFWRQPILFYLKIGKKLTNSSNYSGNFIEMLINPNENSHGLWVISKKFSCGASHNSHGL